MQNITIKTDSSLDSYPVIHDGRLTGILLSENSVTIYTVDQENTSIMIIMRDVRRLILNNFREGNIILDVDIFPGNKLTDLDISRLYGVRTDSDLCRNIKENLSKENSVIVVSINPSYGADFLCACAEVEFLYGSQDKQNIAI